MAKKYMGREWNWWLSLNSHECRFCHNEYLKTADFPSQQFEDSHLGKQVKANQPSFICQGDPTYWRKLYQVWLKHMKQYHPEILAQSN